MTTGILLNLINNRNTTRDALAHAYADGIAADRPPNWAVVNRLIMARWSPSGLEYIKRKAWKIIKT